MNKKAKNPFKRAGMIVLALILASILCTLFAQKAGGQNVGDQRVVQKVGYWVVGSQFQASGERMDWVTILKNYGVGRNTNFDEIFYNSAGKMATLHKKDGGGNESDIVGIGPNITPTTSFAFFLSPAGGAQLNSPQSGYVFFKMYEYYTGSEWLQTAGAEIYTLLKDKSGLVFASASVEPKKAAQVWVVDGEVGPSSDQGISVVSLVDNELTFEFFELGYVAPSATAKVTLKAGQQWTGMLFYPAGVPGLFSGSSYLANSVGAGKTITEAQVRVSGTAPFFMAAVLYATRGKDGDAWTFSTGSSFVASK